MTPNIKITVSERNGRQCASTGSAWEAAIGYSRAIRTGPFISVTGTVGIEADGRFAATLKEQTRRALAIVVAAIEALGGKTSDVVRTRIFLTDIRKWREVGEVHGEFFDQARPAFTMVEVSRLIDDAALIEIEADAIVHSDRVEHL
ncbi:MAG: RidA family protein [Isosphaeraceae bacterium]